MCGAVYNLSALGEQDQWQGPSETKCAAGEHNDSDRSLMKCVCLSLLLRVLCLLQNQPLTYEVSYSSRGNEESRLIYRGLNNTVIFKLPAGDPASSFTGNTLSLSPYVFSQHVYYMDFWDYCIWTERCQKLFFKTVVILTLCVVWSTVCVVCSVRVTLCVVSLTLCVVWSTVCVVCSVRVDIAVIDSLDAATQVCSISVPVTPLDVSQRALWVIFVYLFIVYWAPDTDSLQEQ